MTWPTLPTAPPEQETPPRDLSAFSGEIQASIQRLRRIEGRKPSKQDVVNDFWQ
jgi:hypothetical protein